MRIHRSYIARNVYHGIAYLIKHTPKSFSVSSLKSHSFRVLLPHICDSLAKGQLDRIFSLIMVCLQILDFLF